MAYKVISLFTHNGRHKMLGLGQCFYWFRAWHSEVLLT